MRRYKKKELLETADMLVEANDIIGRLCISNPDRALEILGQCQESAILLGNLIESKGEQYTGLVEILESYCENLYQMSMALSDEEQIRKLSKKIQKQLIHLNNRIRHEIPEDKKEVVFFPYKASMWDSLESVWMAADADEGTDAYVVPIPYYDKNPDGTFREMHYEGNEYPDYVPVTNWEEYDFEERRPDIMFIHNPYDEYNYVTSVHPRFYSGNLKQYTEKLVYIPYFILKEISPDDDSTIAQMKHFFINAAVRNADKVIVQSEDMRQVYIKVLTEELGGSKEAREYWEKKIDGSGSPKVDKVLRAQKEKLRIPEEWMKVIRKPDGSFKKIVFYNTSVTALLQHDEKMLRKMKSVFQTFYENRNEVALLWRPHPLMESTLVSMRPELWEEYRKIRGEYRREGWGIYDDTVNLDRAVVLSDGYYGDGSSIVQLFMKIKKWVMYQSVDVINDDIDKDKENEVKKSPMIIEDCVLINDQVYFVDYNIAVLFSMNLYTGEIKCVDRLPDEVIVQVHLVAKILNYKNKLILIPSRTMHNHIWVYDLGKGIWSCQVLEEKGIKAPYEQFAYATIYGNELFIVGCYYPAIICINLDDSKIEYFEIFKNDLKLHSLGACESVDNQIYIPSPINNMVAVFDMQLKKCTWVSVGKENNSYSGIIMHGDTFWLSPFENTSLVKWDGKNKVIEYELPMELQNLSGCIFNGITSYKDTIWVYGLKGKPTLCFPYDDYKKFKIVEHSYLLCKKIDKNHLILCDYEGNVEIISETEKKKFIKYIPNVKLEQILNEYKNELNRLEAVELIEDDFMQLDRFVKVI